MMRYTLIGLLVLTATVSAQDMPLSQVLIPGEKWVAVSKSDWWRFPGTRVEAVAADADGNPIVARSGAGIGTLTRDGTKEFAKKADVTEMGWSPEGHLLTIEGSTLYRRAPGEEPRKVARGAIHFAVSPNGEIYYIAQGPTLQVSLSLYRVGRDRPLVRGVPSSASLAFWRDGGTLVVGDAAGDQLFTYRIRKDGELDAKEGYYTLRTRGRAPSSVGAMTLDTDGRLYAATAEGVQVFDPTGRMCGVIAAPVRAAIKSMTFAGPTRDRLYVVCDGKLYARKTRVKGFVAAAKKPGPRGPG